MSQTSPISNPCGHDPKNLRFNTIEPLKGAFDRAVLIASALRFIRACFEGDVEQTERLWPSGHIVRQERCKAVQLTLCVLLRHLDLATLYVGHWSVNGKGQLGGSSESLYRPGGQQWLGQKPLL